ncbi:hypothetical protein JAAARDRAFT_195448 [Jaapia argillacea MUCL 33604]|uniref:Uncharacterized protein n=1 Tax=Jaapia argillacea MUCL 33604 TaxID=933084 RepID=A0A067PWF6_9AGAM|nr:hypothetical protein JAAARDRAFT_195448 [Jaapia argillacea MUCL 33604]
MNLPNELLEIIFRYAATSARPVGKHQEVLFPISASHVCGHWRELSLNTPDFWSRLNISILRTWEENRVGVYLERSRNALLDIRLSRHDWADESSQYYGSSMKMPAFISLLLPHIHRWRTFAVNIDPDGVDPDGPYLNIRKQLHDHSAPKLEYLHVSVIGPLDCDEFIPQPIEPILLHGTSALAKVRFGNAIAGRGSLPFQHVTTLDLGFSNNHATPTEYSDVKWVLEASPHLEDLTLRGQLFFHQYNMPVIKLPFLRSLKIVLTPCCDVTYIHDLFISLSTPTLRTLELYALSKEKLEGFIEVMENNMPQSKFPVLETFGLASTQGSSQIFNDLFRVMPQVTHLWLLKPGLANALFNHLVRNMARRKAAGWVPLWPNLSTITFLECNPSHYKSVANFLRKRSKITQPIRNIRIDSSGNGLGENLMNALGKLVEVEEIDLEEERRMVARKQMVNPDCWYE